MTKKNLTQHDAFKQAARDLKTDDDEGRFGEGLGKPANHNLAEKPQ